MKVKGMTITRVLREMESQTGYHVIYVTSILANVPTVDLNLKKVDLRQALKACFAGLNLDFTVDFQAITVFPKIPGGDLYLPLKGRVQTANGEPLEGATIGVEGIAQLKTRGGGWFEIPVDKPETKVTISYAGYSPVTLTLNNTDIHAIVLQPTAASLDEVVVQAYGKTTQRLLTGSVTPVGGAIIGLQGNGNVLGALEGRVPGMMIRQYNGVPGSGYGVLIRGQRSIAQGTNPLIVIDGVPIADNGGYMSMIGSGSAQGAMVGASVLNNIPASAIASVQVLKDAAATAIYGSRGANGVLLVTLRAGTVGKLHWAVDVNTGGEQTVRTSPLMNTTQYLELRKEAVSNDNFVPDSNNIPELRWGTTRYTNFKKFVTGHTGLKENAGVDLSGGDSNNVYLFSGSYYNETAVFPGTTDDQRMAIYGHLHHQSLNRRLRLDVSLLYSWENNLLPMLDPSPTMYLAPNASPFFTAAGQPQWSSDSVTYLNIPAQSYNTYRGRVNNQFNHLQLSWDLLPGLALQTSLGYCGLSTGENSQLLIAGQVPAPNTTGQTTYTSNTGHSELIEEMAHFTRSIGAGQLTAQLGADWQEQRADSNAETASDYTSDLLLATGGGNPTISSGSNSIDYRYIAVFGRLNYVFRHRYIAELSGRRDGSSRFGPGHQWGNFWAASAAWIFGDEDWVKKQSWLSLGKLRGSIGTTGNDQIGENGYTQVYSPTAAARGYQGLQGVTPESYANNDLRWEVNYNSELALDLGFLKDKILLSVAAYRDWTANQLVYLTLPGQSGLPGVFSNVAANVVNEGLEFSLQTFNWTSGSVRWVSTATFTLPVNRLKSFPELSTSIYSASLVKGRSLTVLNGFHFDSVGVYSGLYTFRNGSGATNPGIFPGGNLDAHYYGGMEQSIRYKSLQLDIFLEYRGQSGVNPYVTLYQYYPPGFEGNSMLGNGPVEWLERWHQYGQRAPLQKLTEDYGSAAYGQMLNYIGSDAKSINASFIRWKSCSLSYQLPKPWLTHLGIAEGKVYVRGQNLLTFTHYPITDPETQDPTVLPPTRSLVAGLSLNL
jgi:TonB-linked SusC/RagA family outer membrane protein